MGHSILVAAYHVLAQDRPHHELGGDYFDRLDPQRLTRHLVRRLERLGHKVTLLPADPVAA